MPLEDDLALAAATGNTDRVKILLQSGVDVNGVNCFGRTPLQVMMMGSSPVAQLLLMQGADPNIADRHTGTTPLHDAARMGFLDTVEILVQFLADPNSRDNRNCRPIDLAKESGHQNVVAFLQAL
ncbi:LOW QUALITY PROTEIN: cyclin-dependent kinase 4 inhibitor B-like [Coregonus clupeaformis]|uniref:LOW QUALITY PROTEIN: cyclin-dependent kinase 4 inhibitor B-like n=1 Tax=Coregonus clupeaformis TaxID=59861 RepID=UPI001E1C288D|nr:LOW QUALITY PROTEIN: cyclin-dependent kinase 4 inhibitor B-like [Coregonus clupeaformis]